MAVITRSVTKELAFLTFAPGRISTGNSVAHGMGDKIIEKVEGAVSGYDNVFRRSIENFAEKAAAFRNSFNNAVISDIKTVFAFEIFGFAVNKVEHGQGKRKLFRTGFSAGNIKL